MAEKSYLTAEGENQLRDELSNLKGPVREALSQRLRAAIQMGDLSENADYHAAKEEQAFLEGRIMELEKALSNVVIIDTISRKNDSVSIGSTVTFQEDGEDPETFMLLGSKEADPVNGRISYQSPMGKALLGKKVGDDATIATPNGAYKVKIISIT